MSIESGVLIGLDGEPIYWHMPKGRSAGGLPDSRKLWEVIWENRAQVLGFAHSHPGSGRPGPSKEDVTTFAAVEAGLGKRLVWWITSSDSVVELWWLGPEKLHYGVDPISLATDLHPLPWLDRLREESKYLTVVADEHPILIANEQDLDREEALSDYLNVK
jgi:hypothetical protein